MSPSKNAVLNVLWFCFPHCKSKCGLVEYVDGNSKFGVGNFEFKFYYEIDDNSWCEDDILKMWQVNGWQVADGCKRTNEHTWNFGFLSLKTMHILIFGCYEIHLKFWNDFDNHKSILDEAIWNLKWTLHNSEFWQEIMIIWNFDLVFFFWC